MPVSISREGLAMFRKQRIGELLVRHGTSVYAQRRQDAGPHIAMPERSNPFAIEHHPQYRRIEVNTEDRHQCFDRDHGALYPLDIDKQRFSGLPLRQLTAQALV
jgi:hypothetical protein